MNIIVFGETTTSKCIYDKQIRKVLINSDEVIDYFNQSINQPS